MGATPAFLFVVRHGNRLDTTDKKWHLSSPTPYDPPLTYNGFLQARQVGNQIASILEQAKIEHEASASSNGRIKKRRRFKVVIHSSPFLRCVQTSIGLSSGLAQTSGESPFQPSDIITPATGPSVPPIWNNGKADCFKPAVLRIDSFLGEWLCPEYFEMITPPPGSALMIGSAKAELLRREDTSHLITTPAHSHKSSSGSLWNGSPGGSPTVAGGQALPPSNSSDKDGGAPTSSMAAALSGQLGGQSDAKKGYMPPRPHYALISSKKIPEGFVAHARDECIVVDYQWDSMRPPLDFGDGGQFGEEWTAMHKRFRRGLQKLVAWYSTAENPAEMVTTQATRGSQHGADDRDAPAAEDEDVETVVILVSHGAGCNALIGAITHQPVLMDVGIASITMATRKPDVHYDQLLTASKSETPDMAPHVSPHQIYDIRMSASTDHLRSTTSTPVSSRSASADAFTGPTGNRGRAPSMGNAAGAVMGSFVYSDVLLEGSRSNSASAALGSSIRRNSESQRPTPRAQVLSSIGSTPRSNSPGTNGTASGLWSPAPSSLRFMDDGADDDDDDEERDSLDDFLPNFGPASFKTSVLSSKRNLDRPRPSGPDLILDTRDSIPSIFEEDHSELPSPTVPNFGPFSAQVPVEADVVKSRPRGPVLSAPIRINTHMGFGQPSKEVAGTQLGDGLGGLWGFPRPPGEAERLRDTSLAKRRWTTTERA